MQIGPDQIYPDMAINVFSNHYSPGHMGIWVLGLQLAEHITFYILSVPPPTTSGLKRSAYAAQWPQSLPLNLLAQGHCYQLTCNDFRQR